MRNVKEKFKQVLPWPVWETTKFLSDMVLVRRKKLFYGVFSSFDDVPKSVGYHDNTWIEASVKEVERCRAEIGKLLPNSSAVSKSLLPVVSSLLAMNKSPVRILDFGGAAGLDFANLMALTGGAIDFKYHVVDMPEVCESAQKIWADDPRISFSSELPSSGEFDLVYAYGAIHYVEDYKNLMLKFASYKPAAMLFCKHPIHTGNTFVRCQTNLGPNLQLPQWALSLQEISDILQNLGYSLTLRAKGEDVYNVDNYDDPHKVDGGLNLLYLKSV